ncbi:unnamed protein product [Diplocarpon coronariae]
MRERNKNNAPSRRLGKAALLPAGTASDEGGNSSRRCCGYRRLEMAGHVSDEGGSITLWGDFAGCGSRPSFMATPILRIENKLEHAIRLPANAERRPAPDIAASATARGPRSQENSASLVGVGLNIWLCRCSRRMVLRPDGRGWTCGPEHEIGRICAHEEERAGDDRGPRGCFGGWNFERAGEESAVLEAEAIPDAWLGRGYGMSMPSPCLFILNCREFHRYAAEKANSQVKVGDTRYAFCDQLSIPLSLAHIVS